MKTFSCPFCNKKLIRKKLESHIERNHEDELPENMTSYHLVYDIVNDHPDHKGRCTVCGKPTEWNEKRQKYNRLCGNPKCYEAIRKQYKTRMLKVYGKTSLMDDSNHLEKMLAGRRISGKYKWSDGKIFTYTGSYEKNFLEFLDKTLEYDSNEIIAPGPVLEYDYNGKKHKWITDFLILPYNLIVEIKDGGESENKNPNKKYMPTTRARTVAKEKMITSAGTYSYIRLTNNEFNQFLSLLAELKMNVNEDKKEPLYRIHESYESEELYKLDEEVNNENNYTDLKIKSNLLLNEVNNHILSSVIDVTNDNLLIDKESFIINTEDGEDFLVLETIYPSCKLKNKNFLNILESRYNNISSNINSIDTDLDLSTMIKDQDDISQGLYIGIEL